MFITEYRGVLAINPALRQARTSPTHRAVSHSSLSEGHNGLGLMLLGVICDQVLPPEVYARLKAGTLSRVRGTVQADILKEHQAQNPCISSVKFALRMMGDIQQHFVENQVRNFNLMSISGYHMAEAGPYPITQLAFTLANGVYVGRVLSVAGDAH
ncbi:MAG: hypothetical protein KatS3mg011_2349 [Acidimicrobiia bacterium]|nr:MAG: hypothetical protein KatS3mg011_2349 [Acidimicrobiia bacterium]